MKLWRWPKVGVLVVLVSSDVKAQPVIDGDTLIYRGKTVHLWGIKAPAKGQTCADGWAAGAISTQYLAGLIQGRHITCEPKAGAAGVPSATCKVDGQDLGAAMVDAGMAWADTTVSQEYTVQESNAMFQLLGIHGNACAKAWDWRPPG